MQHSKPKVFFIGFNKTATTAFHKLFLDSGYKSYHHKKNKKKYLAKIIHENYLNNDPILKTIDDADCYSDLVYSTHDEYIEANSFYKEIFREYPNSYYVLQTRNIDNWICSRLKHIGTESFAYRVCNVLDITERELIDYWKNLYSSRVSEIINFYKNKSNFIIFDIDNDEITKLTQFLSVDFSLELSYWKKHNVSK